MEHINKLSNHVCGYNYIVPQYYIVRQGPLVHTYLWCSHPLRLPYLPQQAWAQMRDIPPGKTAPL